MPWLDEMADSRGSRLESSRFTREKTKDDSLLSDKSDVTAVELSRPSDHAPYVGLYDETAGTLEKLDAQRRPSVYQ